MADFVVTGALSPFAIGEKVRATHKTGENPQVKLDSVEHPNKQLTLKPQTFDKHKRELTLMRTE